MTAYDFTIELLCRVDEAMPNTPKHPLSLLHPSEVVTIGLLHALRGEGCRAFDRWLRKELGSLFPRLPERTRLFRLLHAYAEQTRSFLAQPTFFGVCDSFGIELNHPKRERRSKKQIGKKGKSNHRWIVGAKLGLLCNGLGQIVNWQCETANVYDATFHPLLEEVQEKMIVLCDSGFHAKKGDPTNCKICKICKICKKGKWNQRMIVETIFSLFTRILNLKHLTHRTWNGLKARLAYVTAAFNICINWTGNVKLSIKDFAL